MTLWLSIVKQEAPKWYRWLIRDTRFCWFAILVSLMPMLPPSVCAAAYSELWFRSWGALLQLAGIVTTVITIWKTLRDANKPTAWQLLASWWHRKPTRSLTPQPMSSISTMSGASSIKGSLEKLETLPTTVQDQIKAMMERLSKLDEHHTLETQRLDARISDIQSFVHQVRQESDAGDKAIGEQIIEGQTGNLHWAAMGAWWLFVGVILGGWAPELSKWLHAVS